MKHSKNPIYSFLTNAYKQTDDEKIIILKEIEKYYNLSKLIKEDLKQIGNEGKFNDYNVRRNLPILFDFCKSKSSEFLEECFGKSYQIQNPITWRFQKENKLHWVAEEIQKYFKNGKVFIENLQNTIKVKFEFYLEFLKLFYFF